MRLVYEKTGAEVCIGDIVTTSRSETVQVESIQRPHHGGSTGRVYVRFLFQGVAQGFEQAFYPSVICAKWIEREDQL